MACQNAYGWPVQTGLGMAWRMTQVRLSEEARDRLDRLCLQHGVTLTALVEALGLSDDWLRDDIIGRARSIDQDRRSR